MKPKFFVLLLVILLVVLEKGSCASSNNNKTIANIATNESKPADVANTQLHDVEVAHKDRQKFGTSQLTPTSLPSNSSRKSLRRRITPTGNVSGMNGNTTELTFVGATTTKRNETVHNASTINNNATHSSVLKMNNPNIAMNKTNFEIPLPPLDDGAADVKLSNASNNTKLHANTSSQIVTTESQNKNRTNNTMDPVKEARNVTNSAQNSTARASSTTSSTTTTTTSTTTTTTSTTTTTPKPMKPKITYGVEDFPDIDEKIAKPDSSTINNSNSKSPSSLSGKFSSTSKLPVEEPEQPIAQPSREMDNGTAGSFMYHNHRDYIIPIVAIMFAVPILMGMVIVVYRRFRDFWSTRHYRRMDFLVDGMYND